MKSNALKKLYKEIGDSIHAINTIAVSLSLLPDKNILPPSDLHISWDPKRIDLSKKISRSYAERSAIVYAVESFYEYLRNITHNQFWQYTIINFNNPKPPKSKKVYNFLKTFSEIKEYEAIFAELIFNWRNKIIHLNSKAKLSKEKIKNLIKNKDGIKEKLCNFDIKIALENLESDKITIKDTSTLITILLRCAAKVDEHFIKNFSNLKTEEIFSIFKKDNNFKKIYRQNNLEKKSKQIKMWIQTNYPFLNQNQIDQIISMN